jgi:hypothetical protein
LNRDLPSGQYFAEPQLSVGDRIEIAVATLESDRPFPENSGGPAMATLAAAVWKPPAAVMEIPAVFPDTMEVLVFNNEGGQTLVAAIELISPGNKDRPETRQAFAAKCASYLQQGIGLVAVDIVTSR